MSEDISIKAKEALRHIRNSIMHQGKVPTVRELMNLMLYKSPRSAMLLLEELEEKGFLEKSTQIIYYRIINEPLFFATKIGGQLATA